jgi:hypothetical protein
MIKFIKDLFGRKQKIKELEEQLQECGNKLAEKQDHINATNAYWKKKLYEAKSTTKSKTVKPKKKDL